MAKPAPRSKNTKLTNAIHRSGFTPFRLVKFICLLILLGGLGYWLFFAEGTTKTGKAIHQSFIDITKDSGFVVQDILIEGRENTDIELIRTLVNIKPGEPIFALDPKGAREALEKISWVESVSVTRVLPDTIRIVIHERTPLALWQHDGKLALIDGEGEVLTRQDLQNFKDYLLLVGEDAPVYAQSFMELLMREPEIAKRVSSATRVGGRRWDISLENGITIKLPEEDMAVALKQLVKMQEEDKIFSKDIKSIDLRQPDRIMLRTRPGHLQEYSASQKGI